MQLEDLRKILKSEKIKIEVHECDNVVQLIDFFSKVGSALYYSVEVFISVEMSEKIEKELSSFEGVDIKVSRIKPLQSGTSLFFRIGNCFVYIISEKK